MISVIIPVKDGGDALRRCLEGIAGQRTGEDVETLVVDSGSSDGSVELAQAQGARVIEVPTSGFRHGATRNLGAAQARMTVVRDRDRREDPDDREHQQELD